MFKTAPWILNYNYLSNLGSMFQFQQKGLLLLEFGVNSILDEPMVSFHHFSKLFINHLHELQFLLPDNMTHFVESFFNSLLNGICLILWRIYIASHWPVFVNQLAYELLCALDGILELLLDCSVCFLDDLDIVLVVLAWIW